MLVLSVNPGVSAYRVMVMCKGSKNRTDFKSASITIPEPSSDVVQEKIHGRTLLTILVTIALMPGLIVVVYAWSEAQNEAQPAG